MKVFIHENSYVVIDSTELSILKRFAKPELANELSDRVVKVDNGTNVLYSALNSTNTNNSNGILDKVPVIYTTNHEITENRDYRVVYVDNTNKIIEILSDMNKLIT